MFFESESLARYREELNKTKLSSSSLFYGSVNQLADRTLNKQNNVSNYSIFGKRMDDMSREVNTYIKEIEKEIKENKDRIKKFQGSVNGAKYETELRGLTVTLLNNKLAAIKTKADLAQKQDKAYKEDLKLAMDINGTTGGVAPIANSVSTANGFITSYLSNGGTSGPSYNITPQPTSTLESITPITKEVRDFQSGATTVEERMMKEELNIQPTHPEPEQPKEQPVVEEPKEEPVEEQPIVEDIKVDEDEGLDEFIEDPSNKIDYAMSLANLQASTNPNIRHFFKYNQEEGIGYVVAIDEETKEELVGLEILPMDLTYPWVLDHSNKIASVMVREDYPIVYTQDPVPDDIRKAFEIVYNRENGLVKLDENTTPLEYDDSDDDEYEDEE